MVVVLALALVLSAGRPSWPRQVADLAESEEPVLPKLCLLAGEVLSVSGTGISLVAQGRLAGDSAGSDRFFEEIEELYLTLGEGPGVAALRLGRPVLVPDLAGADRRWMWFARVAGRRGVRAAFSFPLRVGLVPLGALTLYRRTAGPLPPGARQDAAVLARAAAGLLTQRARPTGNEPAGRPALAGAARTWSTFARRPSRLAPASGPDAGPGAGRSPQAAAEEDGVAMA
ncbi:MAG: GAF domain-containing protein, partial [Acidimicrobiales bacterium]